MCDLDKAKSARSVPPFPSASSWGDSVCPFEPMRGVNEAQAALGAAPGAQRVGRMAAAVTVGSSVAAPFCRGHTGTERSRAQWATGTGTSQSCRETFRLQTTQAAIPDKHLGMGAEGLGQRRAGSSCIWRL